MSDFSEKQKAEQKKRKNKYEAARTANQLALSIKTDDMEDLQVQADKFRQTLTELDSVAHSSNEEDDGAEW